MKTQKGIGYVWIALALFSIASLVFYDYQTAFAQSVGIEIITVTNSSYGTINPTTADCSFIASTNDITWVNCNNLLYALDGTFTIVANFTLTTANIVGFLPSVLGNSVFIMDISEDLKKYTYSSNTITLQGNFAPTGCSDTGSARFNYDIAGYIWIVCTTEDILIRLNPNTMTETFRSQDLTPLGCDDPNFASYDPADNIGIIDCPVVSQQQSFEITTSSSLTILDTIADTLTSVDHALDTQRNRYIFAGSNGLQSYTYDTSGQLTAETLVSVDVQLCTEAHTFTTAYIITCFDTSVTDTEIFVFQSSEDGFIQLLSQVVAFPDPSGINAVITSGSNFGTVHISADTNNGRIIEITGLNLLAVDPTPIDPNAGQASCNPPYEDVDSDGICDNPAFTGGIGGQPVTNIGGGFLCQLGIVEDCTAGQPTNTDTNTNGIGYVLWFMTWAVSSVLIVSAFGGYKQISGSDKVMLIMVTMLGTASFAQAVGWLDATLFIILIIVTVGFASTKVVSFVSGRLNHGDG